MKPVFLIVPIALVAWLIWSNKGIQAKNVSALESTAFEADSRGTRSGSESAVQKPQQPEKPVVLVKTADWRSPVIESDDDKEVEKETEPENETFRDTEFLSIDGKYRYFVSKEEMRENFAHGLPQEINVTRNGVNMRFLHPNGKGTGEGIDRTFYLADRESLARYNRELEDKNEYHRRSYAANNIPENKLPKLRKIENDAFVPSFKPGYTGKYAGDTNRRLVHAYGGAEDIYRRVRAVDFDLDIETGDREPTQEEQQRIGASIVTMGHGGSLTAFLTESNIYLENGFEWAVYENPFDIKEQWKNTHEKERFYELGEVGVSEDGENFTWLPCNFDNPISSPTPSYCAGTELSMAGGRKIGNAFHIGIFQEYRKKPFKTVKAVAVRDSGRNFVPLIFYNPSAVGFDLDAIELRKAFIIER